MRKLIYLIALIPITLFSQKVVPDALSSGGSHHTTVNLNLDGTLGEFIIETIRMNEIQLTQGFHQGKLKISSSTINVGRNTIIKVYPNPTYQVLIIETKLVQSLKIIVFDLFGNKLINKKLLEQKTFLDLSSFPDGFYFLSVQTENEIRHWTTIEKIH